MLSFVAIDTETTGLDCTQDRIIEIALVKFVEGQEVDCFQSLVSPGGPLPVKIKRLTGLADEDFATAPEFAYIRHEILNFMGDLPLVGHNVQFDKGFLDAACGDQTSHELYDTLELSRLLLPSAPSHRLGELCKLAGVDLHLQHRALDDARGSAQLYLKLLGRMADCEQDLIWQLSQLLKPAGSAWYRVFHDLGNRMMKEFPSTKINRKIPGAFFEEPAPKERLPQEKTALSFKDCLKILGPEGSLAASLPRFRHRSQQCEMTRSVAEAFNDTKILLVEAGTGTGKSLAYLVPSLLWGRQNDERVVVSTHTINLQEQLWNKDIPLLREVSGFDFRAALLKGRSNYLCLRRWYGLMAEAQHPPEEARFLARLLVWLQQTQTGDKSELYIPYQDMEHWYRVCSESDGCLGNRCRYFTQQCFFAAARREADRADLVIINHSLLLSDANADNRILPSFGPLVIDEAHHLESCATEHLGRSTGRGEVMRWLSSSGKQLGRLEQVSITADPEGWQKLLQQSAETRQRARESANSFFDLLYRWVENSPGMGESGWLTVRFGREGNLDGVSCLPLPVDTELDNLLVHLRSLVQIILKISTRLEEMMACTDDSSGIARDLLPWAAVGEKLADDIEFICRSPEDEYVYWIEGGKEDAEMVIRAAPIDVGPLLQARLFAEQRPVTLTSATLTVDGSFQHYRKSIGLELLPENNIMEKMLNSPFNYSDQVLLCATKDILQPGQIGDVPYHDQIAEVVYQASLVAGGRTLVLFTSHRSLRQVYHRLKDRYENEDICLLGHELDGSRSRLVEQFMEGQRTVLFGAASFWEGVDIPGDSLSCVIIVKLPFAPPNQPVIEARLQKLARQGGNGFQDYQLPQAVIKFKQGFGRLIRDPEDKGTVILLDNRLLEKKYGRKFFNSLPLAEHFRGSWQQIIPKVKSWLNVN